MNPSTTQPAAAPETSTVTVLLTTDQTAIIDELALAIRRSTGSAISRSAMVRAMIAALLPYRKEWLNVTSETGLKNILSMRLVIVTRQQEDRAQARS
jgi:hypothetical protein